MAQPNDKQQLLGMEEQQQGEQRIDINEGEQEQEIQTKPQKNKQQKFKDCLWYMITNVTTAIIVLCFVISLFFWCLSLADVPGGPWCVLLGISGLLGVGMGTSQMATLQSLSVQIDRLAISNQNLEKHEEDLKEEVVQLGGLNQDLKLKEEQMNCCVKELQTTADNLKDKLYQFEELHKEIGNLVVSTGKDADELIEQSSEILFSIKMISAENERALIGRIAQDLEFLDKTQGLTKTEFEALVDRLPTDARVKFEDLGRTFTNLAGTDRVVDYMEIQKLIDEIVPEQFQVEE